MYWTIPLIPMIPLEEQLQRLQKYMMVSKPEVIKKDTSEEIIYEENPLLQKLKQEKIQEKEKEIENQKTKIENSKIEIQNQETKIENSKIEILNQKIEQRQTPTQQDTLFWCLFLAKYGYKEYINVGSQHGRKELEEKTKIAEFVGKKKNKLSEDLDHKITNVFCQEMVTDLLTKPVMPLSAIYGFCCFYECSFLIINEKEKTYLSFLNKKNPKPFHIFTKQKYSIDLDFSGSLESHILLHHYEKPLRAISSYTKTELEEIAEKINFEIPEKMKKNELYDGLWKKLAWITK